MADGALSGLTVLDLSQNISGPYCTKLLADYGATVIKIEKPHIGDDARRAGPFPNRTAEAVTINPLAPTHGGNLKTGDTPVQPRQERISCTSYNERPLRLCRFPLFMKEPPDY